MTYLKNPMRTAAFITLIIAFEWICCTTVHGQSSDDILFSIADEKVTVGEFLYIYNKNNSETATTKSTMEEYLKLYENFKLKVHHARQLRMDTIARIQQELAGYREQLANNYLHDESVISKLAHELYDRMQERINVSHILIKIPANSADTFAAYTAAQALYKEIQKSGVEVFEKLAKVHSEDAKTKDRGGLIGWVQAPLPIGYYQLENVAYRTPIGQVSPPVRSPRGYHILLINDKQPSRPEIEISQIFASSDDPNGGEQGALNRIRQYIEQIKSGASFEAIARSSSDDQSSASRGGYVGWIKPGTYDDDFEAELFKIPENGALSDPIKSRIGYHLVKRIDIRNLGPYESEKRRMVNLLQNLGREEVARTAMVNRISEEQGLVISEIAKRLALDSIKSDVFTYQWSPPTSVPNMPLLTYADGTEYRIKEFYHFIQDNVKSRMSYRSKGLTHGREALFNDYITYINLNIEKAELETKYPEFSNLMKEYEDGILLFEITKDNVWDMASSDTIALRKFYDNHRDRYMYPESIKVARLTIANVDKKEIKKREKFLKKHSLGDYILEYGALPIDTLDIQKGDEGSDAYAWNIGGITPAIAFGETGRAYHIYKTIQHTQPKQKAFKQCRGYVIADYQEMLEKKWLIELKNQYPIKENSAVIKQLIAKP